MTKDQQAALEQAAREWLHKWESMDGARFFVGGDRESFFEAFIALLAAQRAAGLEEAALHAGERQATWIEPVNALNRSTQFGIERYAKAEEARYFKDWLRAQAKEQRP